MIWPFLNELNPAELNYYPLVISLDKCNGSCNSLDDLPMILCFQENKQSVKVFNMMKLKHQYTICHVIVNANSIVQHIIQIKNGIAMNVNVTVKAIKRAKRLQLEFQQMYL